MTNQIHDHVTSAHIFLSIYSDSMPNGGLQQSMLRADIPIKFSDIAEALGNLQDKIQKQISTALIYKAIIEAYPGLGVLLNS